MGRAAHSGMPFWRAYSKPEALNPIQPASRAARKAPSVWCIGIILASPALWIAGDAMLRGEEAPADLARRVAHVDVDCYVLQVRPRQILAGQRLFDGLLWVKQDDFAIVRSEGHAVPQVRSLKQENLFPRFTTVRRPIDGKHWFPVYTHADDTLDFRTGPQRIRLMIRYSQYKKFGSESNVTFGKEDPTLRQ